MSNRGILFRRNLKQTLIDSGIRLGETVLSTDTLELGTRVSDTELRWYKVGDLQELSEALANGTDGQYLKKLTSGSEFTTIRQVADGGNDGDVLTKDIHAEGGNIWKKINQIPDQGASVDNVLIVEGVDSLNGNTYKWTNVNSLINIPETPTSGKLIAYSPGAVGGTYNRPTIPWDWSKKGRLIANFSYNDGYSHNYSFFIDCIIPASSAGMTQWDFVRATAYLYDYGRATSQIVKVDVYDGGAGYDELGAFNSLKFKFYTSNFSFSNLYPIEMVYERFDTQMPAPFMIGD